MKNIILFILFVGFALPGFAQNDSDSPELGLWRGGSMSVDFFLGPDFINSGRNSRTGGVISPRIQQNSAMLNTNPAMLATIGKLDINIDSRFGLGTWMSDPFVDVKSEINSEIATETDNLFNDPDNFYRPENSRTIPTNLANMNAGLPGGIKSLSLSYPIHEHVGIGVGYSNAVLTDLNFRLNGATAKLAQEEGSEEVSVRFDVLMNIAAHSALTLEMQTLSAGFGATVLQQGDHELMAGGTFTRYSARNERFVNADLSGMVVVGFADERYFNNQNDPNINFSEGDTNRLYFNAQGNFTDMDYGYRGGLYYRYKKKWGLSLTYVQNPSFLLEDPEATSEAYLPIFVVGDNLFTDDIDVELDRLEANKPNLTTRRDISEMVKPAEIQLPSYLGVGLDIPFRNHTLALNFKSYTSDFRFAIGDDAFGKTNAMGAGLALDFQHTNSFRKGGWALIPLRLLLLDIDGLLFQAFKKYTDYRNPHVNFGGSVMLGDGYTEGAASGDIVDLMDAPTPLGFNLGRRYTVFEGINFGFNLVNFPNLMLTYSVGVSL